MTQHLHLIQQAFNRPMLLEPSYAGFFYAYLSRRIGAKSLYLQDEILDAQAMQQKADSFYSSRRDRERSYQVIDNVAIIPVSGTLVNRGSWMDSYSGLTSYSSIKAMINEAMADTEVKGLFFDINSPGGMVSGCFDFADYVHQLSKPTAGFADEMATSAAYAIASQLNHFYLPRTGAIGSVGVVMAHYDESKAYESEGVAVTLIHSGSHKVDGNPYQALPVSVKNQWQVELDETRQLFATTVARGRKLTVQAVLDTEAQIYLGQHAVDVGFADAVMTKDQALQQFIQSLSSRASVTIGANLMSDTNPASAENTAPMLLYSQAQLDAAVTNEGNRIYAIIGSDEAKGREATALSLAKAGMGVEAAKSILSTVPQQFQQANNLRDVNKQALEFMSQAEVVESLPNQDAQRSAELKQAARLVI